MSELPISPLHAVLLAQAIAFALLAGAALVLIRLAHRQRTRMQALEARMDVFAEASIRVADQMDSALHAGHPIAVQMSSRRQIVGEARARVRAGARADRVSDEMGLNEDERQLLMALPPIGVTGRQRSA